MAIGDRKEYYYDPQKNQDHKCQAAQALARDNRTPRGTDSRARKGNHNDDIRLGGRCRMNTITTVAALIMSAVGIGLAAFSWGREIGESEGYSQGFRDGQSSHF